MAIARWDPWKELAGVERQFEELASRLGWSGPRRTEREWAPALDVHQDGDTMVVRADIAGVSPEEVDITIQDDVLTISGTRQDDRSVEDGQWIRRERVVGRFRRAISLPPGVSPDDVTAVADNGVIEIRVPRPRRAESHRVPLQGTSKASAVDVGSTERASEQSGEGAVDMHDRDPAEGPP